MTEPHFVILSGAYCDSELIAEFGQLPPSLLPVANGRLFDLQVAFAKEVGARTTLSLPSDFQIDAADELRLEELGVGLLRVPGELTLAQSLAFVLETLGAEGDFHLLHGDTLVAVDDAKELDVVWTRTTDDFYEWAEVYQDEREGVRFRTGLGDWASPRTVACGYFSFSDAPRFLRCLHETHDFVASLNAYSAGTPLATADVHAWYDFGHLGRYYRAKRDLLVTRSFNHLQSDGVAVTKSSSNPSRVEAEANWYEQLPKPMRVFTPQFLGRTYTDEPSPSYSLEYLCLPTLADLFVFGRLPRYVWRRILQDCAAFLEACERFRIDEEDAAGGGARFHQTVIVEKTRTRVESFCDQTSLSGSEPLRLDGQALPSLDTVVDELLRMVPETRPDDLTLWHGDFCFSNILYDIRAQRIKTVDPRGMLHDGSIAMYGDRRYDRAKLAHSVLGRYDEIMADRAVLRGNLRDLELSFPATTQTTEIQSDFLALQVNSGRLVDESVVALSALLFLSMLPLHAEKPTRQMSLFANGLRLYRELEESRP